MNKKVWRDGYKYPQNSIPPFFHYILIVKCQLISFKIFNTKYKNRVKFSFVRCDLGSLGKISRRVLLVCSYLRVEEKCGRLNISVYEMLRKTNLVDNDDLDDFDDFVDSNDKFYNNFSNIIHRKHATKDGIKLNGLFNENGERMSHISRSMTLLEIRIRLLREGIESNPGPESETLKIITVNCNGLTSDQRLLQAIGKIKRNIKLKDAIIFLQETHNANLELIENLWQGNVNIAAGTGGSRGVITLSTKNLKVISFQSDSEGRFLFKSIDMGNNRLCHTANIYSPNNHTAARKFYENLFKQWDEYYERHASNNYVNHIVLAGDLNCVINDGESQNRNRSKAERDLADDILNYTEDRGLFDTVLRSPNGNNFTWNRGNIFSKIDYIFADLSLLSSIKCYETIWDLIKSDHAAICLNIDLTMSKQKRGRSYPKLISMDINDKRDRDDIGKELKEAISNCPAHWNPHQKLEYVKVVLRTKTLEIRAHNKVTQNDLELFRNELLEYNKLPFLDEVQTREFNELRMKIYREEEKAEERLRIMAG